MTHPFPLRTFTPADLAHLTQADLAAMSPADLAAYSSARFEQMAANYTGEINRFLSGDYDQVGSRRRYELGE